MICLYLIYVFIFTYNSTVDHKKITFVNAGGCMQVQSIYICFRC